MYSPFINLSGSFYGLRYSQRGSSRVWTHSKGGEEKVNWI